MKGNDFPKGPRGEKSLDKRRRYVLWLKQTRTPDDPDCGVRDLELRAAVFEERSKSGRASLMLAIKARCWQCESVGDDPLGARRIEQCGIHDCALWAVRPYKPEGEDHSPRPSGRPGDRLAAALAKPQSRRAAVRGYCYGCMGGKRTVHVSREIAHCPAVTCALWPVRAGRDDEAQEHACESAGAAEAAEAAETVETAEEAI